MPAKARRNGTDAANCGTGASPVRAANGPWARRPCRDMPRSVTPVCVGILLLLIAIPLAVQWAHQRSRTPVAALIITRGGTYTGTWTSDDPDAPVVLIRTRQPVVLEHCTFSGPGNLIETRIEHADVTVRDCRGTGRPSTLRGRPPGRFLTAESFDRIVIENNDLENSAGIYLLTYAGDFAPDHTIKILRNRARNIDGRKSDGKGGFLDEAVERQFVQLDKVRHLGGIEIAWNEVVNEPGRSGCEDVINIYLSSGISRSRIHIHDNFIQGSYPPNPLSSEYSGGGILLGDGSSATIEGASGFVEADHNQVLDTTNYGIAISAGHDSVFHDNRILSIGSLPDGRRLAAQNTGAYIWDIHHDANKSPPTFFNNRGHHNLIGWARGEGRNDWWVPDASQWKNNTHWPGQLTRQLEADERSLWDKKVHDAGQIGMRVLAE